MIIPDLLADHDVSGGTTLRTLPLILESGDSITAATIVAVDKTTLQPISGDTLTIWGDEACTDPAITFGLIGAGGTGDVWGVNFFMLAGTAGAIYLLQLRYWLASQPDKPKYDELYRVRAVG